MFKLSSKNRELKIHWNRNYFYEYSYNKLNKCERVLDIGCGFGTFLKLGPKNIYGIDANYENISDARHYSKDLVQGDVLELPFSSLSFDGINCSHVIEHLNSSGAYKLLMEMDRVLKTAGILVISSPVLWSGFYDDLTHVKPYNPEAILHYYGNSRVQTTKKQIGAAYEIEDLKWRYTKQRLNPFLLPRGGIVNALLHLFTQFLNDIGFGKYEKTGYTLVLRKV